MATHTNNTSSNRSWLSTSSIGSASRDQDDDCHSIDSLGNSNNNSKDPHNTSTGTSSSRSRGDRYKHYRRDAPTRVKPWLRDKAVVGSGTSTSCTTAPTIGSATTSRFGGRFRTGSATRYQQTTCISHVLSESNTSVGSNNNSCANSVSSASSYPEETPSKPLPREVLQLPSPPPPRQGRTFSPSTSNQSFLSNQYQKNNTSDGEEDVSNSTGTAGTDGAVRQQQQEDDNLSISARTAGTDEADRQHHQETEHVCHLAAQHKPLETDIPIANRHTQNHCPRSSRRSLGVFDDDTATVDTEAESVVQSPVSTSIETDEKQHCRQEKERETLEIDHCNNLITTSSLEEKKQDELSVHVDLNSDDVIVGVETTSRSTPAGAVTATMEETTPTSTDEQNNEKPMPTTTTTDGPASNDGKHDGSVVKKTSFTAAAKEEEFYDVLRSVQPSSYNPMAAITSKEEEVYDVLLTVQPSSYNPMAATAPRLHQHYNRPISVAAYATLDKPTPLVTAQTALLQDAIEEEASESEEETSLAGEDKGNANNAEGARGNPNSNKEETSLAGEEKDNAIIAEGASGYSNNNKDNNSALEDGVNYHHDGVNDSHLDMEHSLAESNLQDLSLNVSRDESFVSELGAANAATWANVHAGMVPSLAGSDLEKHRHDELSGSDLQETPTHAVSVSQETIDEMNRVREEIARLELSNSELLEKLRLAEEREQEYEANSAEYIAASKRQIILLKEAEDAVQLLETTNTELLQKLQNEEAKTADAAASATLQAEKLQQLDEDVKQLAERNANLVEQLRLAEESVKSQEAKNADAVASAEAQADMMSSLCEEMKRLEETNAGLQEKLNAAEQRVNAQEANIVAAEKLTDEAKQQINKLNEEMRQMAETNAGLLQKLKVAEEREKLQTSQKQNITLIHVGDMPVDVGRLRIQCRKYFNCLRVSQLKSHCIRDKSPVTLVIPHNPKARQAIDIQAMLDKGAEIEAQDTTYLFRSLDTFNKGNFHTHRLLIPWKISSTAGGTITRSEFFSQVWQQLGGLKVKVGEKKMEIPLFQESKGTLIPMPNAVLEGKLQCSPAELDRIFAARIAPYYRAIGRLIMQCIAATADDNQDYSLKIAGSVMPMILRHKLVRGVDPLDESYPLEQLLDHAFSLLNIEGMTRDKAFEYFSIDVRSYPDVTGAVKRVREEVHEMWIKERSLALKALEEGLTLNGLADLSFCCGLVPLEAVNEILFSQY